MERLRKGLVSNLRGKIEVLKREEISLRVMDRIDQTIFEYTDTMVLSEYKIPEVDMSDAQFITEEIIEKPYRDWMAKRKTKIRYNFAEDTKRT
jgi:hypothetical protein